eukprot:7002579-Prymnesium_polylepis.1
MHVFELSLRRGFGKAVEQDTLSKSNERLEIGRSPHQKKHSFLSRFDCGGATLMGLCVKRIRTV